MDSGQDDPRLMPSSKQMLSRERKTIILLPSGDTLCDTRRERYLQLSQVVRYDGGTRAVVSSVHIRPAGTGRLFERSWSSVLLEKANGEADSAGLSLVLNKIEFV